MIREITTFTSERGDDYSVELIELNHHVVCVIPTLTLKTSYLPPELFQNVIDHIITLDRDYIRRIYFDNVRVVYRFIAFQLFGHIRGALRKELMRPLSYQQLKENKDDYRWMESEFLPRFPDELESELHFLEKRIKMMYWAFRRGKMNGVSYVLSEDYDIVYNYFFDLDPTDIKPVFDVYVNTSSPKIGDGDPDQVTQMLLGKFDNLGVKLIFRKE